MKTAREILNQIRWDDRLTADSFAIGYYDRVEDEIVRVAFKEIQFPDDHHFLFEVVDEEGDLHSIPYHRVKEIYQNGRLIWHRNN
ncbi:MAG: DUF504 domain-containing protein [Gammaproteobacteria bacterium]